MNGHLGKGFLLVRSALQDDKVLPIASRTLLQLDCGSDSTQYSVTSTKP